MKVEWLSSAKTDLLSVRHYISEENPLAAKRVVQSILSSIKNLGEYPYIGRPGRVINTRELLVSNTPYIVPYRVKEKCIQILRVIHSAKKWPAIL